MRPIFLAGLCLMVLFIASAPGDWTQTNSPRGAQIRAFASTGTSIFALTASSTAPAGVFRSTDNGKSWIAVNAGLPVFHWGGLTASGTSVFVGTEKSIFKSTDDGSTWKEVTIGIAAIDTVGHPISIQALAAYNGVIYAGGQSDQVLVSTDNGQSWSTKANFSVYSFSVSEMGVFAAEGMPEGRVFWTPDSGNNWKIMRPVPDQFGSDELSATVYGNAIFIPVFDKGIYRSKDTPEAGVYKRDVGQGRLQTDHCA